MTDCKDEKDAKQAAEQGTSSEEENTEKTEETIATESEKQAQPEEDKTAEPSAEAKYEELNDRYLRLNADFQNFRRRSEKERTETYGRAQEDIVSRLLEVADNFERALAAESTDARYKEGVELIFKQLMAVLEKSGVKEIEALGKPFDPSFHEAVMSDASSEAESGTVTKVFIKGYMMNNRVIRAAKVAVAQ